MTWENGSGLALTEVEEEVRTLARNFARKEVLPKAAEIDKNHRFPAELIPEIGALGFFGACIPETFGGAGLSQIAYCLIIEELAAACASTSIIVSAHHSLCVGPILSFGTEEQKKTWLPDLATGKKLGCFALSEPQAGSDAGAIACTVDDMGDHYLVNGIKNWITNATNAKTCVLFATSDKSKKHKGISALVHDMTLPGISLGKPEEKMGIRGSSTASIIYDNVKMPKDALLLNNGDGFKIAMTTLNGGRTGVAAQAIGIARASLKDALDYAKERESFGKKICEHQSIQNYLAEMVTKIDAARLLNIAAARNKDLGLPYTKEAAQAKLFASETAVWCALKGIQIFGGNGYVTDYPAERHLRDAKITEIYEGTSEIQKIVIAAQLIKE